MAKKRRSKKQMKKENAKHAVPTTPANESKSTPSTPLLQAEKPAAPDNVMDVDKLAKLMEDLRQQVEGLREDVNDLRQDVDATDKDIDNMIERERKNFTRFEDGIEGLRAFLDDFTFDYRGTKERLDEVERIKQE